MKTKYCNCKNCGKKTRVKKHSTGLCWDCLVKTSTKFGGLAVVFDPLGYELGGFKRGTYFTAEEIQNMVINHSFTENTILQDYRTNAFLKYTEGELVPAPKKIWTGG